jgi:GT2 family glycosyltransferase
MNVTAAETPTSASTATCDIVVVSYNQRERLLAGLASAQAADPNLRLIVVDNASGDGSAAAVREAFPRADLLALDDNVGFAAAVNRGAALGTAPHILLLNNDARLTPEALERLTRALDDADAVAAGPRLLGAGGAVELSLDRTLSPWNEARFKILEFFYRSGRGLAAGRVDRKMARSRQVRSLSGACILLERDAFEEVGGCDERFFLYAEDVDLCLRLRQKGGKLLYVADAVVEHDRGASSATDPAAAALHYRRSQLAFYRKHRGVLATRGLRFYLAVRFAIQRLLGRGREQRELAGRLLNLTVRESGK